MSAVDDAPPHALHMDCCLTDGSYIEAIIVYTGVVTELKKSTGS